MLLKVHLGKNFSDITKSTSHKSKNKYVGLHKTKKLSTAKETLNKMKMQPMEWKKILTNHVSGKYPK